MSGGFSTPGSRGRPGLPGRPEPVRRAAEFLGNRMLRRHRKAWSAAFAALILTALLLGSFAQATLSVFLSHPQVERYAATAVVVSGNQSTRYTAKPWGSSPQTEQAALTERVRVPRDVLTVLTGLPGVEAVVADDIIPVALSAPGGGLVAGPDSPSGNAPLLGHAWETASLTPFTLRSGTAPAAASEVVLDGEIASRRGITVGDRIVVQLPGGPGRYTVSGIAAPEGRGDASGLDHQGALFFDDAHARDLAGRSDTTDAVGVVAEPGVSTQEIYPLVRQALDAAPTLRDASAGKRYEEDSTRLRVLTGSGRGGAEFLEAPPSRMSLLMLLASVCAVVVMVSLLVVAATMVQVVQQRASEMALLRAVGATPRQLRAVVRREVTVVAMAAGLLGAAGSVPVFLWLIGLLRSRGAVPLGLHLPTSGWFFLVAVVACGLTLLAARVSAALACGRIARISPTRALGEAEREPAEPGRGRTITGLVLAFAGLSSAGTAVLQQGELAVMAASTAALVLVIASALLGPWIARFGLRALGGLVRQAGGSGGYLAAATAQAGSRRLGAAITPIVLVVAFTGVQLTAGSTLDQHGSDQARQAIQADLAVTTDGPGLPDGLVDELARLPGVTAATGEAHSTVVLARREAGAPVLERLPAIGVRGQALPDTLDPEVISGDIQELRDGTVALGTQRASALNAEVGSTVTVRLGDGTEAELEVVAVYARSLALGDFLFSSEQLARHSGGKLPSRLLLAVAPDADTASVARVVEQTVAAGAVGAQVTDAPEPVRLRAEDHAAGQVLTMVGVSVIGGFTIIAVLSTLTLIVVGRRAELTLLRMAGASRGQVRRMLLTEALLVVTVGVTVGALIAAIPVTAFSLSVVGGLPYLPPYQAGLLVAVIVVTALAGYLLPARAALRRAPPATLAR